MIFNTKKLMMDKRKILLILLLVLWTLCNKTIIEKNTNPEEDNEQQNSNQISQQNDGCQGCAFCLFGLCFECIDDLAFLNQFSLCECTIEWHTFDTEGKCVECRVNGCQTCIHDGSYEPILCDQCLDANANLIDGKCICHQSQTFSDGFCSECPVELVDGKCQSCSILGCAICEDGQTCTQCRHPSRWTAITDNQCKCIAQPQNFDSEGYCVECKAIGCKVCQHTSSFQPSLCHQCLDPNADLIDGKCVCDESQIMLDGICSECPVDLVDGKCQPCPILGCAVCKDGQTCDHCTHQLWTVLSDQCACERLGESFNTDGVCTECQASGCLVCSGGQFPSTTCFQCLDERAILNDGECVCEGGVQTSEGTCAFCAQSCPDQGCACCDDSDLTHCFSCIKDNAYVNEEGQCQCSLEDETLDTEGYCVECRINGCKVCLHDGQFQPSACYECVDPNAQIINGKCVCDESQIMLDGICQDCPVDLVDGKCQPCPILGCAICEDGETCDQCSHESDWSQIAGDQCQCLRFMETFNAEGVCSMCSANGCKTCENDVYYSSACAQCLDERATPVDGVCQCEGAEITEEGMCMYCAEQCSIPGCTCCDDRSPNSCLSCTDDPDVSLIDGQCSCDYFDETLDTEGYCVECRINGCKVCLHDGQLQPSACHECVDANARIVNGKCVCDESQIMLDGICSECPTQLVQGKCQPCSILGCAICEDGQTCDKCTHESYWSQIQDGQCECYYPDESFNTGGTCFQCDRKGCALCLDDADSSCFQCIDDNARPVDGDCVCKGAELNSEGYCGDCTQECSIPGCACCFQQQESLICLSCIAEDASLDEEGQCQCQYDDETFDTEGYCVECRINGCKVCLHDGQLQPSACHECVDANARIVNGKCVCDESQIMLDGICSECPGDLVDGKCQPCPILGCALCEDGQTCDKCTSSDLFSFIQDGQCKCVYDDESFNAGGVCVECQLDWCAVCADDQFDSKICARCIDEKAVVSDTGECTCDGVDFSTDGYCLFCSEECDVVGCSCCNEDAPHQCIQCIDEQWTRIDEDGKCHCFFFDDQKPDSSGICRYCYVDNCASCVVETNDQCYLCEVGYSLEAGVCVECSVQHCAHCSQTNVCSTCVDNRAVVDESCQCIAGMFETEGQCHQCIDSCLLCYSLEACEKCGEGMIIEGAQCVSCGADYYVADNKCHLCQLSYCGKCVSEQVCGQCEEGALLENGQCYDCEQAQYVEGGECKDCPMLCTACTKDSCSQCLEGRFLVKEDCRECEMGSYFHEDSCYACEVQHCVDCSEANTCDECTKSKVFKNGQCEECDKGTYYADNACLACQVEHCLACSAANSCEECAEGLGFVDGTCKQCEKGTYLQDNSCHECSVEDCVACSSVDACDECVEGEAFQDGQCRQCEEGHYLEDNSCKPCSDGCLSCTSLASCSLCGGQKVLKDGQCVDCDSATFFYQGSCHTCQPDSCFSCQTPTTCQLCDVGTVLNEDKQCQPCPEGFVEENRECAACNVDKCSYCSEVGVCYDCMDEKAEPTEDGSQCLCKHPFIMDEEGSCFYEPPETTEAGTFTTESGQEGECPAGCQDCSSASQCSTCLSNYFKDDTSCVQCDSSCLTCNGATAQHCLSCPASFYLSGATCLQCSDVNCLHCSSASQCDQCADKLVPSSGQCVGCPSHCVECSSPSICTECEFGFSLQADGECLECLSSCSKCSSSDIRDCQACSAGKYLLGSSCQSCEANCLECDSPTNCLVCDEGFELQDGDCSQECSRPCLACFFSQGRQKCTECLAGYTLMNNECYPDYSCNQQDNCEACPYGSALVNNNCRNCSTPDGNCRRCSSEDLSECLSCYQGYFLAGNSCRKCRIGCDECQSENFCVTCSNGYFQLLIDDNIRTGKCSLCQHPCLTCEESASSCTSCVDGFSREGWKCISDIQVAFKLTIDAEIQQFVEKVPEFKTASANLITRNIPEESITLTLLDEGSVKVQGSFQAQSADEGQAIFEDLTAGFKKGASIMGYNILQSEVEKRNIEDEQQQNDFPVGAIIGIVVGVVFLLILVIIICVWRQRKEKSGSENPLDQNGATPSEQKIKDSNL